LSLLQAHVQTTRSAHENKASGDGEMTKQSQCQRIIEALDAGRYLTTMSIMRMRIANPTARISDIRASGYPLLSTWFKPPTAPRYVIHRRRPGK
jgi:hypothetical protein